MPCLYACNTSLFKDSLLRSIVYVNKKDNRTDILLSSCIPFGNEEHINVRFLNDQLCH